MASNAETSHGTLLQRASAVYPGDSGYTTVSEITSDITFGVDQDMLDATHHGSGGYEDFKNGIKRIEALTFEVNWLGTDDTQDFTAGLGQQFEDGTKYNFQIVFPSTGQTFKFAAFVKSVKITGSVKGILKGSITLQPSGAPVATMV